MDLFSGSPTPYSRTINNHAFTGKASHPTASWRQMSITNPVLTRLYLVSTKAKGRGTDRDIGGIVCDTGITIGQLADAHKKKLALHPDCSEIGFECIRHPIILLESTQKNLLSAA